jgi:hypothetical protein
MILQTMYSAGETTKHKKSGISESSWQRQMALSRWENEGGAGARDTQQVLISFDVKTEHSS